MIVDITPDAMVEAAIRQVLWKAGYLERDPRYDTSVPIERVCAREVYKALEECGYTIMRKEPMTIDEFDAMVERLRAANGFLK